MTNWEIAQELKEIRKYLELKQQKDIASLFEQSYYTILTLDFQLEKSRILGFLPRIVSEQIEDLLVTGISSLKESLKRQVPKSLRVLYELPEIRAENIIKLHDVLGIDSISELKKCVFSGQLRTRPEFGRKFEDQLRRSILAYENNKTELNFFEAQSYANSITLILKGSFRIEVAGSARRGKEVVSNINFVVDEIPEVTREVIKNKLNIVNSSAQGNTTVCRDKDDFLLLFHCVPGDFFASGLQYYTGSKLHNAKLIKIGKAKGFCVSSDGYLEVPAKTETEFYEKLGMEYIPPEIREGDQEIELAISRRLPALVDIKSIKGDLHVHTSFSDGYNSIEELKSEAEFLNYEYLAVTDHSRSLFVAHGLNRGRLHKQFELIDKINRVGHGTFMFKGLEADILDSGNLDIDDADRKSLDVLIGAVHTFSQDSLTNTFRVKKALNSGINILAHPTGRLYGIRSQMDADYEEILSECAKHTTALEINLFPNRIDLSSDMIKMARKAGVKLFAVNTDAHNIGHLSFMKFGTKILRRAWMEPSELLNTKELGELKEFLWTTRP